MTNGKVFFANALTTHRPCMDIARIGLRQVAASGQVNMSRDRKVRTHMLLSAAGKKFAADLKRHHNRPSTSNLVEQLIMEEHKRVFGGGGVQAQGIGQSGLTIGQSGLTSAATRNGGGM